MENYRVITLVAEFVFGAALDQQPTTLLLKDAAINVFNWNLRILWPKIHLCRTNLGWSDLGLTLEIFFILSFPNS